jgi:hypothetical protein
MQASFLKFKTDEQQKVKHLSRVGFELGLFDKSGIDGVL